MGKEEKKPNPELDRLKRLWKNMEDPKYVDRVNAELERKLYSDAANEVAYDIASHTLYNRGVIDIYGIKLVIKNINQDEIEYTKLVTDYVYKHMQLDPTIDLDKHFTFTDNIDEKVYEFITESYMHKMGELADQIEPAITLLQHVIKKEDIDVDYMLKEMGDWFKEK